MVGDPHRIIADTDYGFDPSADNHDVADEIVWAKLAALVEGPDIVSRWCFQMLK